MPTSPMDMMAIRQAALDAMSDRPAPAKQPFAGIRVDAREQLTPGKLGVPAQLVEVLTDRLVRDDETDGIGAAVVGGLSGFPDMAAAREFHEELFRSVLDRFRERTSDEFTEGLHGELRVKTGTISDGAIPLESYGSAWSFKKLHADRDALLFSHLYGPVAGFTGGALLLVDIRAFLYRHALRFADLFHWSQEATPGSKPVLPAEHERAVLDECGVELPPPGPDEVVFVNNLPTAGILHGVTPVTVVDQRQFVREYHRCSVKAVAG